MNTVSESSYKTSEGVLALCSNGTKYRKSKAWIKSNYHGHMRSQIRCSSVHPKLPGQNCLLKKCAGKIYSVINNSAQNYRILLIYGCNICSRRLQNCWICRLVNYKPGN